jgi:peroxiredoxin
VALAIVLMVGCKPQSPPEPKDDREAPVPVVPDDSKVPDETVGPPAVDPTSAEPEETEPQPEMVPDPQPPAAGEDTLDPGPEPEPKETSPPADAGAEGVPPEMTPSPDESPSPPEVAVEPKVEPTQETPIVPLPPADTLHEPTVVLSDHHAAMCMVSVGDEMPPMQLMTLDGTTQDLRDFLGEKLTVVVFWSTEQALGREQFERLQHETVSLFRGHGVNVLAINVGDTAEEIQQLYDEVGGTFACLIDADQSQFATIASSKLPRTYLLDAQARILWFDIEYSRAARRELRNAVYFFLQQASPVP